MARGQQPRAKVFSDADFETRALARPERKGRQSSGPAGIRMPSYPKLSLRGNPDLVGRLAKLIPRLASDHDGEVIATVAAIKRTLEASGFDFNDLASAVSAIGLETASFVPAAMPFVRPDWSVTVRECGQHWELLSAKEQNFIDSMMDWEGEPTEKQLKWLRDIARRLQVAA
jgi:hypothetical protein